MGIKNLNTFLRKNCPHIFETIHLSDYAFKKVAIDTSLYMCKFKASYGENWIGAFINLVASLRKNEIHCVFIYDTGSPPDKANEKAERALRKDQIQAKVNRIEEGLNQFYETNEVNEFLKDLYLKQVAPKEEAPVRLLNVRQVVVSKEDEIDISVIEAILEKTRRQILNITPQDFELTRQLFDILKVPYFMAIMEAETFCSDLCKRKLVDAVLTEDTDVLAYGADVFLSKIDTTSSTCTKIVYETLLEGLKLSDREFLDLCIMIGCDYNKNMRKVGPETSYKLILQHKSIDSIKEKTTLDTTILRYERCRELFLDYERSTLESVPYCGSPCFETLVSFIKENNIANVGIESLREAFVRNVIIFEDDEETSNSAEI